MGILIFLFVISFLVAIHEWGHYFMAKCCGIRVERFSIGFGPVLFRWRPKSTEFCFSLIPLGGYVKMAGDQPHEVTGAADEFESHPNWQKLLVVLGGPLVNAIGALLIFWFLFVWGTPSLSSRIGEVVPDYPAQKAGIQKSDVITQVNGKPVQYWTDLVYAIRESGATGLELDLLRNEEPLHVVVSPQVEHIQDLDGRRKPIPRIGIAPSEEVLPGPKHSLVKAFGLAAREVYRISEAIVVSIGYIVTGKMSFKESMTGPVGIYHMTQQASNVGILFLLYFMAQLSVSLFVLNLFPLPVLDGGHAVFILYEMITRRKISLRFKEIITQIGVVLLLGLTVYVLYMDSLKFGVMDHLSGFLRRIFSS